MEISQEIKDVALVWCAEDRMRIASFLTTRIRLREGGLSRVPADDNVYRKQLQNEIASIKGQWQELLGTEYPALF
jgi:hypothetical protein